VFIVYKNRIQIKFSYLILSYLKCSVLMKCRVLMKCSVLMKCRVLMKCSVNEV
jgi:hypothetical protein